MDAGKTHYTPAVGIPELKQAVCDSYARDHGLTYQPNQVAISNGAKHSIHNVLTALCGHGHLDLASYEKYLSGEMVDYDLPDSVIADAMASVPVIA